MRRQPPTKRHCLKCRKAFRPKGRFYFLCDSCRKSNAHEFDRDIVAPVQSPKRAKGVI